MICIFVIVVALLLIAGPFRRRLLGAWRFTLPAAIGGITGFALALVFVRYGAPPWMIVFGPIVAALMIGSAGKKWLDENFGQK